MMSGTTPNGDSRGWNNNVFSIISDGDGYDETTILHETAHQLMTLNNGNAEHKLISEYDFILSPEAVDQMLKDAYEIKKKPSDNEKK